MTSDVLDRRFHGVAIYNPDLLSKGELIAQFVARKDLLDELIADLRRPKFTQHQIIVGSRGMGKTTLLRRIRFAVEDDPELNAAWMPLTFPEEQYNVARLSDFYLNVIDALSDTLEERGHREQAAALDAAVEEIPRGDETKRAEAAVRILVSASDSIGRRLLLLVDNLDLVLERLEKQGSAQWSFRELLSRENRVLLIGAMPVFVGATYDYDAPFYDFFRVHELHGLNRSETRNVLTRLAVQQGSTDVETLIRDDFARIDTLHTLTGGNPRTIILLFSVLAQGTEGDVRTDLEKLLDHCTPLYKARFEAMAPQQQQVVDAVAIHWDPITAGDLAEKLGLDVNTVSAQLNRLVQQGIIEKVEYYPPKKIGFQIAERFFNIWYLMRASRRVRRRLLWLVEFLRLFYGSEHMRTKARVLLSTAQRDELSERLRDVEFCLAVAQVIDDDLQTRNALESRAIRTLIADDRLRDEFAGMFDLNGADASLREVVDREWWMHEFARAVEILDLSLPEKTLLTELIGESAYLTRNEKLAMVRAFDRAKPRRRKTLLEELARGREDFRKQVGSHLAIPFQKALREGYVDTIADEPGALMAAKVLGAPEIEVFVILDKPESDQRIAEIYAVSGDPFVKVAYAGVVAKHDASRAATLVDEALEQDQFAYADWMGSFIFDRVGRLADAAAALKKWLDFNPSHAFGWARLGDILNRRGQLAAAADAFQRAASLSRDHRILRQYGRVLLILDRNEEAELLLREAFDSQPSDMVTALYFGAALAKLGRASESLSVIESFDTPNFNVLTVKIGVLSMLNRRSDAVQVLRALSARTDMSLSERCVLISAALLLKEIDQVRTILRELLPQLTAGGQEDTKEILDKIAAIVANGQALMLRGLIEELELEDPLRVVYEALGIAGAADRARIRRLSPEIQEPVLRLLDQWSVAKPTVNAKKKRPSKKKKRTT